MSSSTPPGRRQGGRAADHSNDTAAPEPHSLNILQIRSDIDPQAYHHLEQFLRISGLALSRSASPSLTTPSLRSQPVAGAITASPVPSMPEQVYQRATSSVIRRLVQENRLPSKGEEIARLLELLPKAPANQVGIKKKKSSLSLVTTKKISSVVESFIKISDSKIRGRLEAIPSIYLEALWAGGDHISTFRDFVKQLRQSDKVKLYWSDGQGKSRTGYQNILKSSALKKTDSLGKLARISWPKKISLSLRGKKPYVEVTAEVALAVTLLERGDHLNFSRVVAVDPKNIIDALLDDSQIGHGAIFSERNIWLTLAHGIVPLKGLGGIDSDHMGALTRAFENFLEYHNPENLPPPYKTLTKPFYKKSKFNIDCLVNHPNHFRTVIFSVFKTLCPPSVPYRDLLGRNKTVNELDASLASFVVNIVFSGVDLHLRNVLKRHRDNGAVWQRGVEHAASTAADAAAMAPGGEVFSDAFETIAKAVFSSAVKSLQQVSKLSDYEDMRNWYSLAYLNATNYTCQGGQFIISQRLMTVDELEGLAPKGGRGSVNEDELGSSLGSPPTKRKEVLDADVGPDRIDESELSLLRQARTRMGMLMSQKFDSVGALNPYTPRSSY